MSDTTQARRLIASQAAEMARRLAGQFQSLERVLNDGSVYHFTQKENRTGYGIAEFLYETMDYDDDRPVYYLEIEKLKSFLNAVMALEKVEQES